MKKWLVAALYILSLTLSFIYRNEILGWLDSGSSPLAVIGVSTLLALFPVVPYKLVIAVLGYAFGTLGGAAAAWIGTTAAALVLYAISFTALREQADRLLKRHAVIRTFSAAVERHPFQAVLLARLLPVVPQTAVNLYAGAAGLPFGLYFAATALGKVPALLLYAWLGQGFADHPVRAAILTAMILAAGLTAFRLVPRAFRREDA